MRIAVYCGSGFGKDPAYEECARELGRWIGKSGHTLVYGGGESGLMGAVAEEVFASGSAVTGVLPADVEFIKNRPQPYCTEVLMTRNMSERKERMLQLADAFIALPGGIGTLDEISEAITLSKLCVFHKPCILFDRNAFYAPLKLFFDQMDTAGFFGTEPMDHVLFSDDTEEIGAFLEKYREKYASM